MPWQPHPDGAPADQSLHEVTRLLDPVLVPLGFAPGQVGVGAENAQVVFCRGEIDSADDGCTDLVLDLEATPEWRVADVRYWGFSSDQWHLAFDHDAVLMDQLSALARTLPGQLP